MEIIENKPTILFGINGSGKSLLAQQLRLSYEGTFELANHYDQSKKGKIEIEDVNDKIIIYLNTKNGIEHILQTKEQFRVGLNIKAIEKARKNFDKIKSKNIVQSKIRGNLKFNNFDFNEWKTKPEWLTKLKTTKKIIEINQYLNINKPNYKPKESIIRLAIFFRHNNINNLDDFKTKKPSTVSEIFDYIEKTNYHEYQDLHEKLKVTKLIGKNCPICGKKIEAEKSKKALQEIKKICENFQKIKNDKIRKIKFSSWVNQKLIKKLEKSANEELSHLSEVDLDVLFRWDESQLMSSLLWTNDVEKWQKSYKKAEESLKKEETTFKIDAMLLSDINDFFKKHKIDDFSITFEQDNQSEYFIKGKIINDKITKEKEITEENLEKLSESQKRRIQIMFLYKMAEYYKKNNSNKEIVLVLDDPIDSMDEHVQLEYSEFLTKHNPENITLLILTHSFEATMLLSNLFNHNKVENNIYWMNTIKNNLPKINADELNIVRAILTHNIEKIAQEWKKDFSDKEKYAIMMFWRDLINRFKLEECEDNLNIKKLDKWRKYYDDVNNIKTKIEKVGKATKKDLDKAKMNIKKSLKKPFYKSEYKLLENIMNNLLSISLERLNGSTTGKDMQHTPGKYIAHLASKIYKP